MLPDKIVDDLVRELAGEAAIPLVNLIKKKGNVSEFKLAEKLNITVNQGRNLLYKLGSHNLVSFTRKKDKKKGWYIYYWSFDFYRANDLIKDLKKSKLGELKEKLNYESGGGFFVCPDKHIRMKFENALETEFKCPECGKVLKEHDNKSYVEGIRKRISGLESELAAHVEIVKPVVRLKKKPKRKVKIRVKKKLRRPEKRKVKIRVKKKLRRPKKKIPKRGISKGVRKKVSKRRPEKAKKRIKGKKIVKFKKSKKKKVGWFGKLKRKLR